MEKLQYEADSIKLKDLLKVTSLLPTGGMAKNVIRDGLVKLNGKVEYTCGKRLKKNDLIEYDDTIIEII
ncbi:MAG: RNA-binding S4 domain-containing protein [Tissierellia bacterium]|nr:RNA-binding S4 domain-containing protein [Tissierellia bacterium]